MQDLLHTQKVHKRVRNRSTDSKCQLANCRAFKAMVGLKPFPLYANKSPAGPGHFMKSLWKPSGWPCGTRKYMGHWPHQMGYQGSRWPPRGPGRPSCPCRLRHSVGKKKTDERPQAPASCVTNWTGSMAGKIWHDKERDFWGFLTYKKLGSWSICGNSVHFLIIPVCCPPSRGRRKLWAAKLLRRKR